MLAESFKRKMRHDDAQKVRETLSPISGTFINIFKVQKKKKKRESDVK